MNPRLILQLAASALLVCGPLPAIAQRADIPVGRWEGRADHRTPGSPDGIAVALEIAADSSVRGSAGAATLRNGRIRRNPSLAARLLGLGTTWVIEADLEGVLVAGQVPRPRVRMPISRDSDGLWGDFNAGQGRNLVSVRLRLALRG